MSPAFNKNIEGIEEYIEIYRNLGYGGMYLDIDKSLLKLEEIIREIRKKDIHINLMRISGDIYRYLICWNEDQDVIKPEEIWGRETM